MKKIFFILVSCLPFLLAETKKIEEIKKNIELLEDQFREMENPHLDDEILTAVCFLEHRIIQIKYQNIQEKYPNDHLQRIQLQQNLVHKCLCKNHSHGKISENRISELLKWKRVEANIERNTNGKFVDGRWSVNWYYGFGDVNKYYRDPFTKSYIKQSAPSYRYRQCGSDACMNILFIAEHLKKQGRVRLFVL